jgi:hypothetical protein
MPPPRKKPTSGESNRRVSQAKIDAAKKKLIQELKNEVLASPHFPRAAERLDQVLSNYVAIYPAKPNVKFQQENEAYRANRLKRELRKCFRNDRRFWRRPDQLMLVLESPRLGLELRSISELLEDERDKNGKEVKDGRMLFWFHQLARLDEGKTLFGFAEPLFFLSRTMNAYFRFLDIDFDDSFDEEETARTLPELASRALKVKLEKAGFEPRTLDTFVHTLDLIPVRLYVPAGDAFAISWIRRWFRHQGLVAPSRKENQRISLADRRNSNLVVLASRRTHPLLRYLREKAPYLACDLTEKGARIGDESVEDCDVGGGAFRYHVIVTNWAFGTENVYTMIASNHTRASGRLAQLLVAGPNEDSRLDPAKLVWQGKIPHRLQLVFTVVVNGNETHANEPIFHSGPFVYDSEGRLITSEPIDAL